MNADSIKATPKAACENCTYALKGNIKENYTGWEGDK